MTAEDAGDGVNPGGDALVMAGLARVEIADSFGVRGDLDEGGREDVVVVSGGHAAGPDSSSQNLVSRGSRNCSHG